MSQVSGCKRVSGQTEAMSAEEFTASWTPAATASNAKIVESNQPPDLTSPVVIFSANPFA
jgi:hypothetical protein